MIKPNLDIITDSAKEILKAVEEERMDNVVERGNVESLQREVLQEECDVLRARVKDLADSNQKLDRIISDEHIRHEGERFELEEKAENAEKEVEDLRAEVAQSQQENDRLGRANQDLSTRLANLQAAIESLSEAHAGARELIEFKNKEIGGLQCDLRTVRGNEADLKGGVVCLGEANHRLVSRLDAMTDTLRDILSIVEWSR